MKHSMRLRTKMTLWYTAFTFVVAALFCAALYIIIAYELQMSLENETRLSLQQVIAQIENENGLITFENEVPLSSNIMFYVTEENGSELASYGDDISLFDQVPVQENTFSQAQGIDTEWLLLDSGLVHEDQFVLRVRVAASYAHKQEVLSLLRLLFLTGVPLLTLLSSLGGFTIAKRSLLPIKKIITSADIISQGDLSRRVPATHIQDELGELTDALNGMLTSVEATFEREKQFSCDASHELRTPVTVMRAYTETLLKESALTPEQRDSLQTILTECTRMQKIINHLLTITQGQQKQYPVQFESIRLYDVLESVKETMEEQLTAHNTQLQLTIPANAEIQADQSLLTQMLLNLVENAIKYGKEGGLITVSSTVKDQQLLLSVKDDGIGIPKESLPRIFDRFYRVDASRDRSGTGLGLSIVQWIVQLHHGKITAHSKPGQETEFIVTLNVSQHNQSPKDSMS